VTLHFTLMVDWIWWGRRRKQLLDDLKERRGYWKLNAEALDLTLWRTRFGRGCGPVIRQTTEWMNEWMNEWVNEWIETYTLNVSRGFSFDATMFTRAHQSNHVHKSPPMQPCSQEPTIGTFFTELNVCLTFTHCLKSTLIISSHLCRFHKVSSCYSDFLNKHFCALLIPAVHAACPNIIPLFPITLVANAVSTSLLPLQCWMLVIDWTHVIQALTNVGSASILRSDCYYTAARILFSRWRQ
jgi:hypothetical protein